MRQELARARQSAVERQGRGPAEGGSGPAEPAPPRADEEASPDDEDFAPSGAVGREVVERVLGGKVLGEFEDH